MDRTDLEDEVYTRHVFSFYAKREFEKWETKRAELEVLLKQTDIYVHSLKGDLDIFRNEVFHLSDELHHSREVNVRGQLHIGIVGVRVGLRSCSTFLCPWGVRVRARPSAHSTLRSWRGAKFCSPGVAKFPTALLRTWGGAGSFRREEEAS